MEKEFDAQHNEGRTNADAAIEAGIDLGRRQLVGELKLVNDHIGAVPYMLDQDGAPVSLERFREVPLRQRAKIATRTPAAFAAYVMRFKLDGETVAFPWMPDGRITAVIDYHHADNVDAGTGEHIVTFAAAVTPDWRDWTGIDGRYLAQADFADFIEDHISTIGEPVGAALLELVQNFQVSRKLTYRSAVRTQSGTVQLTYDQEEEARGQQLAVPAFLSLVVATHEGADVQLVRARLRYRIGDTGALTIGVKLLEVDKVVERSMRQLFERAEEGCPGVPFIEAIANLTDIWGPR